MNKRIIINIIIAVLFLSIGVNASLIYSAINIEFNPNDPDWNVTNINEAVNDIHENYFSVSDLKEYLKESDYDIQDINNKSELVEYFDLYNSNLFRDLTKFFASSPSNTTSSNTTTRTFSLNTSVKGLASDNYYNTSNIKSLSISKNSLTINSCAGYGVGFVQNLEPEENYKFIAESTSSYRQIDVSFYTKDGTHISHTSSKTNELLFTVPSNAYYSILIFNVKDGNCSIKPTVTYNNIQLRKI